MKRYFLASTFFFFLLALPAQSAELGRRGHVFPIEEADLMAVIEQRLQSLQAQGYFERLQQGLLARTETYLDRPPPVEGLAPARETRSWIYNPTLTLSQDIRGPDGRLYVRAGTQVNPLDQLPYTRPILFIDADRPEQLAWAQSYADPHILLVGGRPAEANAALGRWVYFDQQGRFTRLFGLQHTPGLVQREGRTLRVTEVALEPLP